MPFLDYSFAINNSLSSNANNNLQNLKNSRSTYVNSLLSHYLNGSVTMLAASRKKNRYNL